jgi:Tfp pilus assembly protein PilX
MSIFNTVYETRYARYEKGAVLLFTLMVMIGLTSVVGAYLGFVQYSTRSTGAQISDSQAIYLAEAGLQKAVWNILTPVPKGGWGKFGAGQSRSEEASFGAGTYSVTASRTGNTYTINSTGTVEGLSRSLQQQFSTGGGPGLTPVVDTWHEI